MIKIALQKVMLVLYRTSRVGNGHYRTGNEIIFQEKAGYGYVVYKNKSEIIADGSYHLCESSTVRSSKRRSAELLM